jgi:hypothetical protein
MPTFPIVFSQLADRLLASGAQVSPRTMKIMSAAMSFLEAIGNPLDDNVATAAYATTQLKSDDAEQVAIALGVSPDLIPRLTPTVIGVDHQLGQVLAMGSRSQAVVAATVLFSWHAMAATAGDDKQLADLRRIAETATLQGSQNQGLAQTLAAEMAKVTAIPRPEPARSEYVFSISIDLVGSTDAKTRVMNLVQGDVIKFHKFNELIYREFCQIERKFYESAVSHQGVSEAIDPSNLFTVKGIGDEIWILCAVAEQDIPGVGCKLIDASIQVATQTVSLWATQNEDDPRFDRNFDYGRVEPIRSPIKIFVDVVGHASNLGRVRDEGLMTTIPGLLKTFHGREPTTLEIARVARRLCLSSYEPIGWSAFHEFRTDYIGHEIDRFFRTTKAAIPGTVTIGASLAHKMGLMFQPVKHGIHGAFTSSNMPLMGGFPADPVHARIRTFEADQLKGIGYAYDTYTLFGPRSLNGVYVMMAADRKNGIPVMPYDDTEVLIPPGIVQELATEIVKRQKQIENL